MASICFSFVSLIVRYSQINELSSKVVSLIPKEDFEFIQSVDIASMHIQNTKLDLERIRSTTEGIVELAELLNVCEYGLSIRIYSGGSRECAGSLREVEETEN